MNFTIALAKLSALWTDGKIDQEKIAAMADRIRAANMEDPSPMLDGQTLEEVISSPSEEAE